VDACRPLPLSAALALVADHFILRVSEGATVTTAAASRATSPALTLPPGTRAWRILQATSQDFAV